MNRCPAVKAGPDGKKVLIMKKRANKTIILLLSAVIALALTLPALHVTFCEPTGSAGFSGTEPTLDVGQTCSFNWAIQASEPVRLEASFAASPGLTITSITCAQAINGGTTTSKVLDYSGNFSSFSGTITVRADAPSNGGKLYVKMTEVVFYSVSTSEVGGGSISLPSFGIYVRTEAERQAEASRQEEERQRQESIRREQEAEASRQQSEAQSRAESISASASEEERRRKESEDAAYREWARQSSIEASIAASKSAEEAAKSRAESEREASISASESEIEASISASESEYEASVSASESEVERTRPSEIGRLGVVRYAYGRDENEDGEGDQVFYFVTEGSDVPWPEGAEPISMRLNDVNVLALRMDGMASNTYLVYGMREENDVPAWEFWHRSTAEFFRYDYLNSDTHYVAPSTEAPSTTTRTEETVTVTEAGTTTAPGTQTSPTTQPPVGPTLPIDPARAKTSVRDMIFLVIAGAIGGAALTALIFVLVLKVRKKGGEKASGGSMEKAAPVASEAPVHKAPEAAREKTGDTDAVDLD